MSDQDALSVLSSIDEGINDEDCDCENESHIRHQAIDTASPKLVATNKFLFHPPKNGQASPFFNGDIVPHPHSSMEITGVSSLSMLSKAAASMNGVHSSPQLALNPRMSVPQETKDGAVHHCIVDLDADIEENPKVKNLPDLMHSSQSSSHTATVPKGGDVFVVHHHIVDLDDDNDNEMVGDTVVHHHIVDLNDIIGEDREDDEELQNGVIICAPFARTTSLAVKDLESAKEGAVLQESDFAGTIGRLASLRQGDCLQWCNVCMTVKDHPPTENGKRNGNGQEKNGKTKGHGPHTKKILDNVYGQSPAGQVTAIMGTSGSGKTSLLNILSGRVSSGKDIDVQANIIMNGRRVNPATNIAVRQSIAFVTQDDSLQVTATPREAIAFSARLRLSKYLMSKDIDELTQNMINELNLNDCADTIVGGALIKGISGGERKRTSVGVELVTQPAMIMLDEATSGLDSFNALELCQVLKRVALEGASVLMTIHQPSSEIFNTLDRLVLLQHGQIMYEGIAAKVPLYFAQRGYPCPEHFNPADWILTISQTVSMESLVKAGFFDKELEKSYNEKTQSCRDRQIDRSSVSKRAPVSRIEFFWQTGLLLLREIRNIKRNTHALKVRTGMTVMISLLISIIFYKVATTSRANFINVQSTFGSLLMALLANIFSTVLPSLVTFPEERPVFVREYSTNHYSVAAYFASRFAMELLVTAVQVSLSSLLTYFMVGFQAPFGYFWADLYLLAMTSTALGVLVGCSVTDPHLAFEFMPLIFMPQILFAGFFVPPDLIPIWLRWLVYAFPLTYAVRLALVLEFNGECDGYMPNYCDTVMTNVHANPNDTWWYWLVLGCQFAVFRLLALFILRRKATKYF